MRSTASSCTDPTGPSHRPTQQAARLKSPPPPPPPTRRVHSTEWIPTKPGDITGAAPAWSHSATVRTKNWDHKARSQQRWLDASLERRIFAFGVWFVCWVGEWGLSENCHNSHLVHSAIYGSDLQEMDMPQIRHREKIWNQLYQVCWNVWQQATHCE